MPAVRSRGLTSLVSIAWRNLLHRPTRSLLTAAGIAIGFGAVVALTSLAWGFQQSWEEINEARGTDLIVVRQMRRGLLPAHFPEGVVDTLAGVEGVAAAAGVLNDVMSIEHVPTLLVHGWQLDTFVWRHLALEQGRWPAGNRERVVVLGTIAAELLGKSAGDELEMDTETFGVSGIFRSPAAGENTGVVMPLGAMQELVARAGMVNLVNLRLDAAAEDGEVERVRARIGAALPGYRVFDGRQAAQASPPLQVAKAMSLGTSVLALVIGGLGIMNTMVMSIAERRREIGLLVALGWRRRRVAEMILLESLLLSAAGGLGGIALGLCGVRLLPAVPWLPARIDASVDPLWIGAAFAVALAVGAVSALYPAWRGTRTAPVDALRVE